jgi:hypothetical protein
MACLTFSRCRNVCSVFTHGNHAVMAVRTTAEHFAMINPQCWCKLAGGMAGFTGIAAQDMRIALANRRHAIMAIEAIIDDV